MFSVTADQMRRLDRLAQEKFRIPELILMEHAGTAVAREAKRLFIRLKERTGSVVVLAGGGANGGDGLVAARHLDNAGIPVEVVIFGDRAKIRGAALTNLEIVHRLRIPLCEIVSRQAWSRWVKARGKISLVVDALLGTGVNEEVREPIRSAIGWINTLSSPVVAVDLPSGLCADSGLPCGIAVRAAVTVTCGLPKVGLKKGRGPYFSGRVVVADISFPRLLLKPSFLRVSR